MSSHNHQTPSNMSSIRDNTKSDKILLAKRKKCGGNFPINQANKKIKFLRKEPEYNQESSDETASTQTHSSQTSPEIFLQINSECKRVNQLTIWSKHQDILKSIECSPVTVIVGEPGSGKTTQLPQMILNKYSKVKHNIKQNRPPVRIAITQPRRLAAIRLAKRVLDELTESRDNGYYRSIPKWLFSLGKLIGYSVRFDHCATSSTAIKFLTDGCLLREFCKDQLLKEYDCVILDEAHERSVRTDILLGLFKILLTKRPEFRLIIMSATLDYQAFISFMEQGSTVLVPGRQFPIRIHSLTRSGQDFLNMTVNAILQTHFTKKEGGHILAFLPGQDEIEAVQGILSKRMSEVSKCIQNGQDLFNILKELTYLIKSDHSFLGKFLSWQGNSTDQALVELFSGYTTQQLEAIYLFKQSLKIQLEKEKRISLPVLNDIVLDYYNTKTESQMTLKKFNSSHVDQIQCRSLQILPLYANLSIQDQQEVFSPSTPDVRKVILATNIAETSLTIPGIRFVIDTGLYKSKTFNPSNKVDTLSVEKISRAMANQRSGRAGRECAGEVYRLYSVDDYMDMEVQAEPEIKRSNLTQVLLELMAIGVNDVKTFPFMTKPSTSAIDAALKTLMHMNAIDTDMNLTAFGKNLSLFPLDPELAYFLLNSVDFECVAEALTLTALLQVESIWHSSKLQTSKNTMRKQLISSHGDHLSLINAYNAWESVARRERMRFCLTMGLNYRNLVKAQQVRKQLKAILLSPQVGLKHIPSCFDTGTIETQTEALCCCLVKSLPSYIATYTGAVADNDGKFSSYTIEATRLPVSIHPSSGLHSSSQKPQYVLFSQLVKTSKLYMRIITGIKSEWLAKYHPTFGLSLSKNSECDTRCKTKPCASIFEKKSRFKSLISPLIVS